MGDLPERLDNEVVREVAAGARRAVGEIVEEALELVARVLAKVRYRFTSQGDPQAAWRVVRVQVREELSSLYSCTLELATDELFTDPDLMLGAACEFVMERGPLARRLCGIVHRVEHMGIQAGHLLSRVQIAPALWALSQRADSRIFQEQTVPQILRKVLSEGLEPFNRCCRLKLQREYPRREYCVQYQESDLDFILRLMEEEGIAFYFDHTGSREELILVDTNESFPPCETLDGGAIPIAGPEAGTHVVETVRTFDWSHELQPTSVVVRDFDWTRPSFNLTKQARSKDGRGQEREQYLYPASLTIGDYDKSINRYTKEDGSIQAGLRRQAYKARERRGLGRSNVIGFTPGLTYELLGHGRPGLDQRYLLTSVEHLGEAPEELPGDELVSRSSTAERYANRFECIPLAVPFRPERRRPRPRLLGAQTAKVVGPSGEEIWTDAHGRIKVQFHWDREGRSDERSSCWVRVAQLWGGTAWGCVFLPRIGMEVIVEFLEGDPDRPLVIGCVYNGQNPPPYALPEHKTRSTIKTSSTPGGSGSNELRFEDAAGQEEVFLHAQKDLNEVVKHDHSTTVHANQTITVHANQATTVHASQTNTVDGNQSESIGGEQSLKVVGNRSKQVERSETVSINQDRTVQIVGCETTTIQGQRTEAVGGLEQLKLDGGREVTVKENDKLTVEGQRETQITSTDSLSVADKYEIKANSTQLVFDSGKVDLTANSHITISSAATVSIHAANELTLTCGSALLKLEPDGTVTVQGVSLKLTGEKIEQSVPGSGVTLEPTGVSVSGNKITASAVGTHEIAGAVVKIN